MSAITECRMWALETASCPEGLTPHAKSVADFLIALEGEGLLHQIEAGPCWQITPRGREELKRLKALSR